MTGLRNQIYDLAASVLDVPRNKLQPDARFESYQVDSLALVEFVFAVQERFRVDFEPTEFDGLRTLDDLVAAVERKRSEAPSPGNSKG